MTQTYNQLKALLGLDTAGRFAVIKKEIEELGLIPRFYKLDSPRGKDNNLTLDFDYGAKKELWLTANYDTFKTLPSANNNTSGAVTLLGVAKRLRDTQISVDVKIVYFDAGLDTDLIEKTRRNSDFIPGSELFLQYIIGNEIEFIEKYSGAIVVQAQGKGNLCVFEKTGKKTKNSRELNHRLISYGSSFGISVELKERSPHADNLAFLKEGLEATVLSRYHEGSWHKMQTKEDDMANVNPKVIDETIDFICGFLKSYKPE